MADLGTGAPVRSMRMLRAGVSGISSHRVPGGGTADRSSTPDSCQPPPAISSVRP